MTNAVDTFLQHRAYDRTGGFLENWKKRKPPIIDTWMHKLAPPVPVWQHSFPKLVERENPKTGHKSIVVWGGQWVCHENEALLKKSHERRSDGTRKAYPEACPMCRLIEVVREMVFEGQLKITDRIFMLEGDEEKRIVHAGGLTKLFDSKDLDEEMEDDIAKAGIKMSGDDGAWRENALARCSYVFSIVDNDDPGKGCQIAVEGQLLGDLVKEVVTDRMVNRKNPDVGNPWINPYCIQWEHRPNEKDFKEKYKARWLEDVELTDDILELLEADPPDLSYVTTPFDIQKMRTFLEEHALVDLPWKHIFDVPIPERRDNTGEFPPKEKEKEEKREPRGRLSEPNEAGPFRIPKPKPRREAKEEEEAPDACPICGPDVPEADCPHFQCDHCDEIITADTDVCPKCKHVYREPEPKVAGRGRKRSEAATSDPPYGGRKRA